MSMWFRSYREHSDDPQNSMIAEIYRLILQTRSEVTSADTSPRDLEKKRVEIVPTESYVIIITGNCFIKGEQRPVNSTYKYYTGREPDTLICRCWLNFDYRSNVINDRSLCGNNALLKGYPTIISYQPEYPSSSLGFDGATSYVDMGITSNLKLGEEDNGMTLDFDGSGDALNCGNHSDLWSQTLTKFSFSFWFHPDVGTGFHHLVNHGAGSSGSFQAGHNNLDVFFKIDFGAGDVQVFGSMGSVTTWHHVACVYDSTLGSNEMKLYLNGALLAEGNTGGTINLSQILELGNGFDGNIKDFRWWGPSTALNLTQINQVMNLDPAAPVPNYWITMEEGTGTPKDIIGEKTTTFVGGTSWEIHNLPEIWKKTEITVAAWAFNNGNPTADEFVVSRGDVPSYYVIVDDDLQDKYRARFFYNDGTNIFLDSDVVATTGWHRVMASHSSISRISKFWVDGVLKASNAKIGCLKSSGTSDVSRFMVGAEPTGAATQDSHWQGYIKNVQVYNRQLTDAEALADFNGEYVSPVGLVSEWNFDEDEHDSKALDSQGYNTGTIFNGIFDESQVPFAFTQPYEYKDGVVNYLVGYKTDGTQYLIIPELSDDFRIAGKTTGGATYEWVCKFTTFATLHNNYMRLLQKADDFTATYFQSIQIRDDGKIYLCYKINGVEKKVRTVYPLKLNKLYRIGVGVDYDEFTDPNVLNIFKIYLNGFNVGIESTTDSGEFPDVADIVDFHTYLIAGNEQLRGNLVGQIYSFRYYDEDITDANMLALQTNKYTTRQIDRGHVAVSNLTKIYETFKNRPVDFTYPDTGPISDLFEFFLTDTNPTARFTNTEGISVSDEFDYTLTTGTISLGNYSLNFDGVNDHVHLKLIDPVRDHFSISVWVKYEGNSGGWGGIISRIDGLPNGNRLMVRATEIRWHGQFGNDDSPWNDYRVTVSDISNAWHHIGMTYDGDDDDEFKLFLDGQRVFKAKKHGQIRGRDESPTYLGKGSTDNYYLDGKIDELILYDITLTENQMRLNYLRTPYNSGIMAHYNFERNVRDQENAFHGTLHGGTYSTDTP